MLLGDEPYRPGGPEWLVSWPPIWSADGSTLACRLTSRGTPKESVSRNGQRGEEFDRVGSPALSRDGKRLAYRAQEGNRCFAVVDGRRGPAFEFMSDPAVSADGSVVAYAARRDGRWRLIVGDRERELEGPVSSVFLSADGRSVGWLTREGSDGAAKVRVVVNGSAGE